MIHQNDEWRRRAAEGRRKDKDALRDALRHSPPPAAPLSPKAQLAMKLAQERDSALDELHLFKPSKDHYERAYNGETLQTAQQFKNHLHICQVITKSGLSLSDIACQVKRDDRPAEDFAGCTDMKKLLSDLEGTATKTLGNRTLIIRLSKAQYDHIHAYYEALAQAPARRGRQARELLAMHLGADEEGNKFNLAQHIEHAMGSEERQAELRAAFPEHTHEMATIPAADARQLLELLQTIAAENPIDIAPAAFLRAQKTFSLLLKNQQTQVDQLQMGKEEREITSNTKSDEMWHHGVSEADVESIIDTHIDESLARNREQMDNLLRAYTAFKALAADFNVSLSSSQSEPQTGRA